MGMNLIDQMDIFNQLNLNNEEIHTDYLFIIKDNKEVRMSIEQIFDHKKYDEIYAVTYVSSPSFFSKYTKDFSKISFVLGIDDSGNLEKFTRGISLNSFLDVDTRIEFWNALDEEIKEKIINRNLDIRFGNTNVVIHDKIYLLRSSKNKNSRVVVGSANFTNKAFSNDQQFENVRIDDNNEELFNLYFNRFEEIYKHTYDFIPERCKMYAKTEKVLMVNDGEISKEVLLDEIKKQNGKILIEENHIEEIKELGIEIEYKKENIDRTEKILSLITQKKNGKYEIKSPSQLDKKSIAIKTAFCKTNKNSEEVDERPILVYSKKDNSLMKGSNGAENLDEKYAVKLQPDKLKESIVKINKFIEAYNLFALNPCIENQSKVFEIILYSFMAPYIWKIRNSHVLDKGIESVRADFPPFMIIGGVAKSGKTTALEFVSLLLGNNGKRYFKYAKEVSKAGILFDYFNTENVFPILVDEIEPNFFYKSTSLNKGEGFIKYVSNDLNTKHPVLIGTTNLRDFSSNSQVLRRIYYLEINNVFDDNKKSEAMDYLNGIISDIDDSLFRDFIFRMSIAIKNQEQFYKTDDVLYKAREIFMEYFREAEIDIPKWFPNRPFKDYEVRKVNVWRNLFDAHREYFKENEKDTLYVYIDDILKNMKSKKEKDSIINFLDDTCIIENNAILELDKEKFYNFIGYTQKSTFVQKMMSLVKIKNK